MTPEHLTREQLVSLLDGELSPREAAAASRHLESCWTCRGVRDDLERTIAAFASISSSRFDASLPPPGGPRALLRARLAAQDAPRHSVRWAWLVPIAAAAMLAMVLAWIGRPDPAPLDALHLPNPAITPGRTVPVALESLCAAPESEPPAVPPDTARKVFERYGIEPASGLYELDYLITPALGGAIDERNLWPQPYSSGRWNSRIKDALEDRLRSRVCEGKLDLATAQRELASDWIAAYQRHFSSANPLLAHFGFIKDQPWRQTP